MRVKRIAIGFLATIGGVSVAGLGLFLLFIAAPHLSATTPVVQSFPSPDGRYKALLFGYAEGGPLTGGYCYDKISVVPASLSDKVWDKRYEVYSAECDSFADHNKSPKVEWVSNALLQITFSINSTALFGREVKIRKLDDSKIVLVRFVAHE